MPYKLNQGSSAKGDWAELLLSDDTRIVRISTEVGKEPVIQVFTDGKEPTHVFDMEKMPKDVVVAVIPAFPAPSNPEEGFKAPKAKK